MAEAVQERDRILVERAKALDQLSLRLRRILDTIQAGLVVFREGQVSTVNPAATRYWSLHEGDPLPEALAGLDIGSHLSTPQGDRIFDVEVVPFGESGRLLVGEDVTDRIAAQERLARSERLALVGRMLAQITHEVRNPLNAMSLNAELLSEDLAHTPQSDMVATISSEIRRLDQLTGRYLELSRGRRSELNPVDPLELIRDVQKAESQALQQSGISCEIHGESPGVVEVDTDALRRAFLNILRNASEAGAQNITVHLQTESEQMTLHVRDDGPGIEEEQLNRIFEPFFTTKASGTGLGLAISRQELEEVGGSLQVVSKKDHGCTFLLEIPIRQS
jgi:signal transduction histidine kinase